MICQQCYEEEAVEGGTECEECLKANEDDSDYDLEQLINNILDL